MDDIDRGKKLGASTVITTWHWFPHAAALTNASIRAWQICSLTFKKERGGGLKTLNKESLGPTALLLWIVHDPADGRLHESTGTTSARPWRDGNEAFVLGAGAASQKVKIKTGSPRGSQDSVALLGPITTVAAHKGGCMAISIQSFMASGAALTFRGTCSKYYCILFLVRTHCPSSSIQSMVKILEVVSM